MNRKSSKIKNIFKTTGLIFLLCVTCVIIFLFFYIFTLEEWQKTDITNIPRLDQQLRIYDNKDNIATTLCAGEDRLNIDINTLSENTINAFLAAEDLRFFEHQGIDAVRILGAFISDIKSGGIKEGASTITQQLVKNFYLTDKKTVERKIQEALIALRFEKMYSKEQILEMYLNTVYFGNGAYGIEQASRTYFGISAGNLDIAQAAMIAGLLKAPSKYSPVNDINAAKYRRDTVINNMAKAGFITESQRKENIKKEIKLTEKSTEYPYGYYIDMVLNDAEDILCISSEELMSGGYSIYTELDTDLQKSIQHIYKNAENFPLDASDGTKAESASVVINNDTGAVAAVMGGREHTAMRILSRATMTRRNPGSTIKPILVYAPAIESKQYTTTTMILDSKQQFGSYEPENAGGSYNGWVTTRTALIRSLNIPAIKILNDIGTEKAMAFASRLGIVFSEEDEGLTLALGGFTKGVTPLELAGAYSVFASGGIKKQNYCIKKITDREGNIIYEHTQKEKKVVSSAASFIISDMLVSCAAKGTAKNIYCDGIPIAAKTGTASYKNSSMNQDAWIAAYNPDYTVCCWIGFDATDKEHVLSSEETGGNYPAKIAKKIFEDIYKNKKAPDFEKPVTVLEINIDEYMLEEHNAVFRADERSTDKNTAVEYYIPGTQPKY